uniref:Uncharacterized protein n=1 Tax=Aplanochytrium stocchinoi TaxID=215587 RepID=A0A7S3PRC6_9STRA
MQNMLMDSLDKQNPQVLVYWLGKERYTTVPIKTLQRFLPESDKRQVELRQGKSQLTRIPKRNREKLKGALIDADMLISKVKRERILQNGWIPALGIHKQHLKNYEQFQKEFILQHKTRNSSKAEIKEVVEIDTTSGTFNLPTKQHTALRCTVCKSLYDEPNMLLCDNIKGNCKNCTHIYCSPERISDSYREKEWYCIDCNKKTLKNEDGSSSGAGADISTADLSYIADVRCENQDGLEFFILPERVWIRKVEDDMLLKFCRADGQLGKIVSMRRKNGIPISFILNKVSSTTGQRAFHKEYYFSRNGTKFGVDQWSDLFTENEVRKMQYEVLTATDPMNLIRYKPNTVDIEPSKYRLKLFLGYRYSYGHGCNLAELYDDVESIHDVLPYTSKLVTDRLKEFAIIKSDSGSRYFDQVVANVYKRTSSSLGVHQDDSDLFEFPVFSLRLFSESVLSFGCKGVGMQETDKFVSVPLKRGVLTSMYHIAAENFNHCIRPCDITEYSTSLIFRRVKNERIVTPPTACA